MLSPQTLATLNNLPLVARMVVDGFMTGRHKSWQRGSGMEFSQYRSYQPGDDLRQLDWKLYARSDRYYIREAETESRISVRFILDTSASMAHEESGVTKLQYACLLIAALSYLAIQQGDQVHLYIMQADTILHLTAGQEVRQLQRIWHALGNLQPAGRFSVPLKNTGLLQTNERSITILLSDMYEHGQEISQLLPQLGSYRHEVLLFHLLARNETDFTFTGPITFQDLETGETVQANSEQHRQVYLQNFRNWLRQLETTCYQQRIAYHQLLITEPLDAALRRFLVTRANRIS